MSQLKPMIIVLLMLTSAVSGFMISNDLKLPEGPQGEKGEPGEDGNNGLNADETRIVELEAEVILMSEYVLMLHEYFVIPNLAPIEYENVDDYEIDMCENCTNLNLRFANLSGLTLVGFQLSGSDMFSSNLSGSDMKGNMSHIDFKFSKMYNMDASTSSLDFSDFRYADLRSANLEWSSLCGADFGYANLMGANLRGGSWFCYYPPNSAESDSPGETHPSINFQEANLKYANLSGAFLRSSNFSSANLIGADLSDSELHESDMSYADLTGANLNNADLTGVYWKYTTCPDGTNSNNNGDTCENNLI